MCKSKRFLLLFVLFMIMANSACAHQFFIGNIEGYQYTTELSGVTPFSNAKGFITFYSANPGYIQPLATINAQGLRKNTFYQVVLNEAAENKWSSPTTRWIGYFITDSYGAVNIILNIGSTLPHNPYLPKKVSVIMYPDIDPTKQDGLEAHRLADLANVVLVLKSP